MDVYLVPIGVDRYELYCEPAHDPDAGDEPPREGVIGRLRHRFTVMLRAAEERQHRHDPDVDAHHQKGVIGRVQDRIMAWVAERVAEQRLLWNLRGKTDVTAMHPDDLSFDHVQTLVHRMLQRDYDRHKLWLVVDTILFVASGVFFFVPGPNIVAYYFGFRVVGHWLSMRGASQGLHVVSWTGKPCAPLTELRRVATLEPGEREQKIHAIAERLRLHRFPMFFERVAVPAQS
jgi:hypothetical protein